MSGTVGPSVRKLQKVIEQAENIKFSVTLIKKRGATIPIDLRASYSIWGYIGDHSQTAPAQYFFEKKLKGALERVIKKAGAIHDIDIDSLKIKTQKSPVKGKEIKELCLAALYEFFAITPPSADEIKARNEAAAKLKKEKQAETKALRSELIILLENAEVKKWNRKRSKAREVAPLRKLNLSGKDLAGMKFVDILESDFSDCNLAGAVITDCKLNKSNFANANLENASFKKVKLKSTNFKNTNLSNAKLQEVDLSGVDFTDANLTNTRFTKCSHDETTLWPEQGVPQSGLLWYGVGPDPMELAKLEARKELEGPVDMDTFMTRLKENIDGARVQKALSMLKKDSFQLFVDVTDESLMGVVKSQNDPDLVYSCRLTATGSFCCCTQNLNTCGGLRGSLCKHIMVLMIGLANANDIDADTLDDWVQRSLMHQPKLDKEVMSEILLKYKGADAGEVDWRPTETVPEDFYAF